MSVIKPLVFFDLETTGLDTAVCDIIQLSAVSGSKDFNKYILPRRQIDKRASGVTGLTFIDNQLLLNGSPMDTVPLDEAVTTFLDFLRSFHTPVLLVAHNAHRFDAPLISRVIRELSLLEEFRQVVTGFVDTFVLSKNLFPNLGRYSQEHLVKHFLATSYDAHNAVKDTSMLQELFNSWSPDESNISTATLTPDQF
ncbi:DNA polymerase III PolC-type-like [Centropristis striata]|uniref:DNA polymerase III PolC-type-like n=1 Tax=Centropristis striata TaxID=184440 RepID=UPI0027E0B76F|nr:DNA polymerase III PolC-type-like [Centropristis striata]XP_059191751.1 DNA polymerase III PolC-type-like [Centropristis striata]